MRREIREVMKDKWVASPATAIPWIKGFWYQSSETQHNTTPVGELPLQKVVPYDKQLISDDFDPGDRSRLAARNVSTRKGSTYAEFAFVNEKN